MYCCYFLRLVIHCQSQRRQFILMQLLSPLTLWIIGWVNILILLIYLNLVLLFPADHLWNSSRCLQISNISTNFSKFSVILSWEYNLFLLSLTDRKRWICKISCHGYVVVVSKIKFTVVGDYVMFLCWMNCLNKYKYLLEMKDSLRWGLTLNVMLYIFVLAADLRLQWPQLVHMGRERYEKNWKNMVFSLS